MIIAVDCDVQMRRAIFPGVPINLCFWHVRRAWTKNLMSKVKDPFGRADMNRELKALMYEEAEGKLHCDFD